MDRETFLERLRRLRLHRQSDRRAPHKPLLILYALGCWHNGRQHRIPFRQLERDLAPLLREFGAPKRQEPLYPYYHLTSDGIWDHGIPEALLPSSKSREPRKLELRQAEVSGGFVPEVQSLLAEDADLVAQAASLLLELHFPVTLQDDIQEAVGLSRLPQSPRARRRDPAFREEVMVAYEYRCAVCELSLGLGGRTVGIEAAHLKWVQYQGPDEISNGLALCVLHHKLFDLGGFRVTPEGFEVRLSNRLHGEGAAMEPLKAVHGGPIRLPPRQAQYPRSAYLDWHYREVFKGRDR